MSAANNNNNELEPDMVMCPYNKFHIVLRHRLAKHLNKCHPKEMRAKRETENKKHMEEWERQQVLRPPIQPKFNQDVPPLGEDSYWDEEEPCQPFVPQLNNVIINKKGFIYGKKE
ncbi:hypothetical protein FQR65_LT02241 [Abscondita terminalis]|nr:hypothetical protein FQR65_LT02241 [Abscondita terminalis]